MVYEIAEFHVRPGEQAAFEHAMQLALRTITANAKGVRDYRFFRCVESPDRYVLQVGWDTIEDHMVTYRASPERETWRALVSPYYAEPPRMEHFTCIAQSAWERGATRPPATHNHKETS